MACGLLFVFALCGYILTTMQQGLGVKCVHNRWAYATYTLLYTYARNRAKSAQKRGVGLHYVMGVHYVFYGTSSKYLVRYSVSIFMSLKLACTPVQTSPHTCSSKQHRPSWSIVAPLAGSQRSCTVRTQRVPSH